MKTENIFKEVQYRLSPIIENTVDKLEEKELQYFIEHLILDLEKSLNHWHFKKTFKY